MTALAAAFVRLVGTNPVVQGLVGGVVIAVLNLFGAVLVLVSRSPSQRLLDAALTGNRAGLVEIPVAVLGERDDIASSLREWNDIDVALG